MSDGWSGGRVERDGLGPQTVFGAILYGTQHEYQL